MRTRASWNRLRTAGNRAICPGSRSRSGRFLPTACSARRFRRNHRTCGSRKTCTRRGSLPRSCRISSSASHGRPLRSFCSSRPNCIRSRCARQRDSHISRSVPPVFRQAEARILGTSGNSGRNCAARRICASVRSNSPGECPDECSPSTQDALPWTSQGRPSARSHGRTP